MAGVSASHMLVSQTSTTSAFSSSLLRGEERGREGEPHSSSPSNRIVTWHGRPPSSAMNARQASTKVISWPLSSAAPRATMLLRAVGTRRSAARRDRSPTGRADRRAARRNGRRTARAARSRAAPSHARPPWDGRRWGAREASKPKPLQIVHQPLRGARAFVREGGIGGDRVDLQQARTAARARRRDCRRWMARTLSMLVMTDAHCLIRPPRLYGDPSIACRRMATVTDAASRDAASAHVRSAARRRMMAC